MRLPTVQQVLSTYDLANEALQRQWTRDVGREGYDKRAWQQLANAVDRLARDLATAVGHPLDEPLVGDRR